MQYGISYIKCIKCGLRADDNLGHVIKHTGYHSICLPCKECKLSGDEDNLGHVNSKTFCHAGCLRCKECGLSVDRDYYVNSKTRCHYFCLKCSVCGLNSDAENHLGHVITRTGCHFICRPYVHNNYDSDDY